MKRFAPPPISNTNNLLFSRIFQKLTSACWLRPITVKTLETSNFLVETRWNNLAALADFFTCFKKTRFVELYYWQNDLIRWRYQLGITLKSHISNLNTQRDTTKHTRATNIHYKTQRGCLSVWSRTDTFNWLAYIFPLRNISHSKVLLLMFTVWPALHSSNSQRQISLISRALEK